MSTEQELYEAEIEFLLTKVGEVALKQAAVAELREGAWTGSHGGHDPDFNKLKGGLKEWWVKKAATHPHPFTYCVRHLAKHVADPERLCAWLKDQAKGTTKWRKGNKKSMKESEVWQPSLDELKAASAAFMEAAAELDEELNGGAGTPANQGEQGSGSQATGEQPGSAGSEAGGEGGTVASLRAILDDPDASDAQRQQAQEALDKLEAGE